MSADENWEEVTIENMRLLNKGDKIRYVFKKTGKVGAEGSFIEILRSFDAYRIWAYWEDTNPNINGSKGWMPAVSDSTPVEAIFEPVIEKIPEELFEI